MKLYLLRQTDNPKEFNIYMSIIVCAQDEDDAKTIDPNGEKFTEKSFDKKDDDIILNEWAFKFSGITCKELGDANPDIKRGVIITSYNRYDT